MYLQDFRINLGSNDHTLGIRRSTVNVTCMLMVNQTSYIYRAGDHAVTFVYGNLVSLQIVFAIFLFDKSFKLLLIYINHVPANQIPISSGIKHSNIALVFFYLCLHKLVTHIFNKNYSIKKFVQA